MNTMLQDRRVTHGDFTDHARITQGLKAIVRCEDSWFALNSCQRESVEMILHKIGRILAGDPNFKDHWDDIAGYAKIAGDRPSVAKSKDVHREDITDDDLIVMRHSNINSGGT
jgi:hypothetical protein